MKLASHKRTNLELHLSGAGGQAVGIGSYHLMGTEFQFCKMEKFWSRTVVIVFGQQCKRT